MESASECSDMKRRVTFRNLPPQRSESRVVDTPWVEKETFRGFRKLEGVVWAYTHSIEDTGRDRD